MHKYPRKVKQGIEYFNKADFYEAHEYFEDAWRETEDDSREFYRALLHLSGGYYRLTQDRSSAARKFFMRSLHWLETFPNTHLGLDIGSLKAHLQSLITEINSGLDSQTILRQHPYRITSANIKGTT